jgi:hypothetical protein
VLCDVIGVGTEGAIVLGTKIVSGYFMP